MCSMFSVSSLLHRSFPNNYWDKFIKRKVSLSYRQLGKGARPLRRSHPPSALQVINKYGDLYGAERIAELLGLDKSALDFDPTVETVEKEASLVSWLLF